MKALLKKEFFSVVRSKAGISVVAIYVFQRAAFDRI